jgi:hypothetical protein
MALAKMPWNHPATDVDVDAVLRAQQRRMSPPARTGDNQDPSAAV